MFFVYRVYQVHQGKRYTFQGTKTFSITMKMMNGMDKGVGILAYRVHQVHHLDNKARLNSQPGFITNGRKGFKLEPASS